jgi:hypothetical protein
VYGHIDEITADNDSEGGIHILSRNCDKLTGVRKFIDRGYGLEAAARADLEQLSEAVFPGLTEMWIRFPSLRNCLRHLNPDRLHHICADFSGDDGSYFRRKGETFIQESYWLLLQDFERFMSGGKFPRLSSLDISRFTFQEAVKLLGHHFANFPALRELRISLPAPRPKFDDGRLNTLDAEFGDFVAIIRLLPIQTLRLSGHGSHLPLKSAEDWRNAHTFLQDTFNLPYRNILFGCGLVWDRIPRELFNAGADEFDVVFEACYPTDEEKLAAMLRNVETVATGNCSDWFTSQFERIVDNGRGRLGNNITMLNDIFLVACRVYAHIHSRASIRRLVTDKPPPHPPNAMVRRNAVRYEEDPAEALQLEQARVKLLSSLISIFDRVFAEVPFSVLLRHFENGDSLSVPHAFWTLLKDFQPEHRQRWRLTEAFASHRHVLSVTLLFHKTLLAELVSDPAFLKNDAFKTGDGTAAASLVDDLKTIFFKLATNNIPSCDSVLSILAQVAPHGVDCCQQFNLNALTCMLQNPERATKCGQIFSDIGQLVHRPSIGADLVELGCSITNFKSCIASHYERFRGTGWSSEDEAKLLDLVWMRTVCIHDRTQGFYVSSNLILKIDGAVKWALDYSGGVPPEYLAILTSGSTLIFGSSILSHILAALLEALPDEAPERRALQSTAEQFPREDVSDRRRRRILVAHHQE